MVKPMVEKSPNALKRLDARAQVLNFRHGERRHSRRRCPGALADVDQPVLVAIDQRPQQHAAHQREDGGVGADAERQREHHRDGQPFGARQRADREFQVTEEVPDRFGHKPSIVRLSYVVSRSEFDTSYFIFIRLSQQIAQPVKPAFPHRTAIADPLLPPTESPPGSMRQVRTLPSLFGLHQPAFLQHLQVLNDRGQGDVERLCQPRDRDRSLAELLQNRPARGIAEGVEDTVDIRFLLVHGP